MQDDDAIVPRTEDASEKVTSAAPADETAAENRVSANEDPDASSDSRPAENLVDEMARESAPFDGDGPADVQERVEHAESTVSTSLEGEDEASGAHSESPPAEAEPSEPARSPAEAFAQLATEISLARRDIAQVADFARSSGALFQRDYADVFLQGADAAIRGLIRIDELLFKQTRESTSSSMHSQTLALASMLGQAIEGELQSLDVRLLEPQPGDSLDLSRMVAVANRPAPVLRGRKVGTIAEVISRGYIFVTPERQKILKKAEVVIWRAREEIAFDGTDDVASPKGGNVE